MSKGDMFSDIKNQRTIDQDIKRKLYHINRLLDGKGKLIFEYKGDYELLHQNDAFTMYYKSIGKYANKGQFNRALTSIWEVLKISQGDVS